MIIIIVITTTTTTTIIIIIIIIIITDFNRSDIMFIDMENKTAVVVNIAIPLTYNLSNTETEKITKYENLVLEIKNIWKRNNVSIYTSHLGGQVAKKHFTVPKEQRFNP